MHTDLKYPYVSTRKDALWHLRKGVGVESGFSIILLYFVEIFTEFMYVNRWPLRSVSEKGMMTARMTDEPKLRKRAITVILTHAPV